MQRLLRYRRLPAVAAIFLLSACAAPSAAPPTTSDRALTPQARSGTLLYVANGSPKKGVDILTFPQGTRLATIRDIGGPQGVCADASGHVWITAYLQSSRTFALYEFARGATTPLHTVRRKTYFGECTVDPQGNVAVLAFGSAYTGSIETWRPSLDRKPRVTEIPLNATSGAYDDRGNLYLKGYSGSDPGFAVLQKGSDKVTWLHVKKGNDFSDGTVGWDGTYVTLGAYEEKPLIYRLTIDGSTAKIASVVYLRHSARVARYVLAGDEVVALLRGSDSALTRRAGLYAYPGGGRPIAVFSRLYDPAQLAISSP